MEFRVPFCDSFVLFVSFVVSLGLLTQPLNCTDEECSQVYGPLSKDSLAVQVEPHGFLAIGAKAVSSHRTPGSLLIGDQL
jgi:hypothetical protein